MAATGLLAGCGPQVKAEGEDEEILRETIGTYTSIALSFRRKGLCARGGNACKKRRKVTSDLKLLMRGRKRQEKSERTPTFKTNLKDGWKGRRQGSPRCVV